jgi:hypothetical protein
MKGKQLARKESDSEAVALRLCIAALRYGAEGIAEIQSPDANVKGNGTCPQDNNKGRSWSGGHVLWF